MNQPEPRRLHSFINLLTISFFCFISTAAWAQSPPRFEVVNWTQQPVIGVNHPDVADIRCGFEGGIVIKEGGAYHLFPTERIGKYCTEKTRIGHWRSTDGQNWKRISTLYESSGDTTGKDPRAVFFAAMPVFDESIDAWTIFYVSYRYTIRPTRGYNHADGRIFQGISQVKGRAGIGGPYQDASVVMQPDSESQAWEGHQGVDSFYPYRVGQKWYGFYGSAKTESLPEKPCSFWAVGLAEAPSLAGPWKRLPVSFNPIQPKLDLPDGTRYDVMVENPIVSVINGWQVACIDFLVPAPVSNTTTPLLSYDAYKKVDHIAYISSKDGRSWQFGELLPLLPESARWWTEMRTPLGFIDEGDGTYTVFFTAYKHYRQFASIGRVTLRLKP